MRVRYLLLSVYNIGGAVRSLLNQANALAAEGYDVEVVSVYRRRKRMPFPLDPRVSLRVLVDLRTHPARRPLHAALGRWPSRVVPPEESRYGSFSLATDVLIRRYLKELRDGVVVTGRPGMNLQVARYATEGVVRIGEDHLNFGRFRRYPALLEQMKEWYPRLDAVTALTETTARAYRRQLGDAVPVVRIPNLLPTTAAARAALDDEVIVAAGRLTRQKGFDLLIDAFALVARDHPGWRLRIFGGGPLHGELTKQVADRGLTHRVQLPGRTTRLDEEMAAASMFVLSSRFEGFPMVVLEAMSHGLPVVAFDCHTGPRDILTHDRDGLLVPPRDVPALAAAVGRLIDDSAKRRELGARAVETVAAYDAPAVARQWTSLFEQVGAR